MYKNHSHPNLAVALAVALLACASGATDAFAQGANDGHRHDHGSKTRTGDRPTAQRTAYGGQTAAVGSLRFEVVYRPKETRVYLFGSEGRPVSSRGVQGQVAMQVRGNERVFRYPLKHVTPKTGSDYLAVGVDVSRIHDGDMKVTFELTDLPDRREPRANFTQTFALSKVSPVVRVVNLTDADRAGIAQQKVCAVMGGKLGGMGTPVKVLIDNQPIYLCCKGCLGKVRKDPAKYLAMSNQLRSKR